VFGAAGGARDLVYVKLPNNTTRGVPAWMFDEAICVSVRSAERPMIDCSALLRLAQLLDSVKVERHSAGHDPDHKTPPSTNTTQTTSVPVAAGTGNASSQRMHPGRGSEKVRAAVARTAPSGGAHGKRSGRRLP
jgi:hypothetical protein